MAHYLPTLKTPGIEFIIARTTYKRERPSRDQHADSTDSGTSRSKPLKSSKSPGPKISSSVWSHAGEVRKKVVEVLKFELSSESMPSTLVLLSAPTNCQPRGIPLQSWREATAASRFLSNVIPPRIQSNNNAQLF